MKAIIFLILIALSLSLNAEIILQHFPPSELHRNDETAVILNILGPYDDIEEIVFSYRTIGQETYDEIIRSRFEIISREVLFRLPRIPISLSGYEYLFTVKMSDSTIITLPENQPKINPFRVFAPVTMPVVTGFILLNPVTSVSFDQDLVLGVSFYNLENIIEPNSIILFQNGRDVTNLATITPPLLVYSINNPRSGNYRFQIRALSYDGKLMESPVWSYNVESRPTFIDDLPFDFRGNAVFNSNVRSVSDSNSSFKGLSQNDASLRLNLQARQDWFLFRSRFYLSSYESSSRQAINRYSLGVTVPYFDLDLIDSTPNYGTFLLSNKNIRGVSGKLHYHKVALKSAYGQTARAIDGQTISEFLYTAGTFQRNTLASKLEFGSQESFLLGIGFVKNKDKMSSIDEKYYIVQTDTTYIALTTPKDNFVIGSDLRLALDRQRLIFGAEIAASLYNSNIIDGVLSKDSLETFLDESIPFDPESFESIIIINKNMEPIIPNIANLAYRIYLNWFIAGNFLNVSYSQVGASFRSLSAGYLQNDARIFTISDNVSLLNNQLILDAGLNIIRDNLSEQKLTTTTNTNWYLQSMVRPRELPYMRFGYNTNSFADDLDDSNIKQKMGTFNIGVGYHFVQIPHSTTTLDLGLSFSNDRDQTDFNTFDLKRNSFQLSVFNSLKEIPLVTRFNFTNSIHKDNSQFGYDSRHYRSFSIRNEYSLLDRTVRPYLNLRLNTFSGDQESQLSSNFELGTIYYPFPTTTINTSMELMNYNNKDVSDLDYSRYTWKLNIAQRF